MCVVNYRVHVCRGERFYAHEVGALARGVRSGDSLLTLRMAAFSIAPPEHFSFTQPENWPKWICRFDHFCQLSGLAAKSDSDQVNTLIYSMGDQVKDILLSF